MGSYPILESLIRGVARKINSANWSGSGVEDGFAFVASLVARFFRKAPDIDTTPLAIDAGVSATAIGDDTATHAELQATVTSREGVTMASVEIEAAATACGGVAFADVEAYCDVAGADFVIAKRVEQSGANFETEKYKVLAFDFDFIDAANPVRIDIDRSRETDLIRETPEGNTATVDAEVKVLAEDSLIDVQFATLAIEDQLSESSVITFSAVG